MKFLRSKFFFYKNTENKAVKFFSTSEIPHSPNPASKAFSTRELEKERYVKFPVWTLAPQRGKLASIQAFAIVKRCR